MAEYNNYPFMQVLDEAQKQADLGAETFQKFTCASCGSRQGMDQANHWYTHGKCEECGEVTNIYKDGCNYLLILDSHDTQPKQITVHDARSFFK